MPHSTEIGPLSGIWMCGQREPVSILASSYSTSNKVKRKT